MRLSFKLFATAAVLLACVVGTSVQAGFILQPTGATTNMGGGNFGSLGNLIDQSGLSMGYTSGVTDFDVYIASNPTHEDAQENIYDSDTTTGHIDFNLGSSFVIESFALWNRGGNEPQNVIGFTLFIDDNAAFSSPTNLGNFNANPNTGPLSAASPEVFSFAATAGQFVRMEITSNNGGDIDILGEVAFEQQIPEPTTLALLTLAGGAALLVWRKRS